MAEKSERATKGDGQERPLDPTQMSPNYGASPGQPGVGNQDGQPPSTGIERGTAADWFGPLNPINPTAPPSVAGRVLDYPAGYNLSTQPRSYGGIPFSTLRSMADGYDLVRMIIETRKDEMERMKWSIGPRDPKAEITTEMQGRIKTLEKFFMRPDREHFWGQWLRMVLEDLLVIDAPAIYKRRTRGGELYSLEVIDGATVKRVIDDWGRTPEPPLVAYQQNLKGFPAVNYSKDDLLYRPRNIRAHAIYGYSPVEQIVMTVNIGVRRQVYQLQYFTEGNVPEALVGVPETWTPDQVRQFQEWFDGMLQGNTAERRRAKFVPAAVGKTYIPTKNDEIFGKAEEWLARVCCYAFSVSPQPFLNMMNRATAESAQEVAVTNGLIPLMSWVKGLIDTVLLDEFDETELEFRWVEEDELDPKTESEIVRGLVGDGILTINQGLTRLGEDPRPEPEFDRPMLKTATGYVPVALTEEEKAEKEAKALAIAQGQAGKVGPDGKPLPGAKPGEDPGSGDKPEGAVGANAEQDTAPAKEGKGNEEPTDEDELKKAHRHDDSIKPIERVAMRPPGHDDSVVTFGQTADADMVDVVLNAAAKREPDWR